MFDSFSAFGSFVQTPCGPRKSGMPDSVEMPAPVRATMRVAAASQPRTSWTRVSITFFVPGELYCEQTLEGDAMTRRFAIVLIVLAVQCVGVARGGAELNPKAITIQLPRDQVEQGTRLRERH